MKIARRVPYLAIMVAVAGLLVAGCGEDSTRPDDNGITQENPNLDEPLGGYTSQSEQPCFGDPDLAASSNLEAPTEDPILEDPEVVRWLRSDSVRTYAVTLLWGILDSDPSMHPGENEGGAENLDWSGMALINREGGLVVRATIAFERDDYIVGPREERERVMWVSHTTDGFDGLRLMVLQRLHAGDDGSADSLTIIAGAHRLDFAVNDLAELDRTDTIDDLGNKFAIRSFLMTPQLCNRGFLGGAWLAPRDGEAFGRFQGRWVDTDGTVAGNVRGIWGTNTDGEKVFFGKYVDRAGTYKGIVRGSWDDRGPDGPSQSSRLRAHGYLRGEWVDEGGNPLGTVRGHWRAARDGEDGFFEGAWKEGSCLGS